MLSDANPPIESSTIHIRPVRTEEEWDDARLVRTQVFIVEQKCPPKLEWDEHEATSRHIVGYKEGRPIAAARWRTVTFEGRRAAKLERFAVLPECR
ncbi:MAG: GNAT family N-acetyltransferase, partial [Rhodothermales bacterium]